MMKGLEDYATLFAFANQQTVNLNKAFAEIKRLQAVEQGLFAANRQFREMAAAYRNGDSARGKNEYMLGLRIVRDTAKAAGGGE